MAKDRGVDFLWKNPRSDWLQALPLPSSDPPLLLQSMSELAVIQEHSDLYLWLNGEIQHFMPHRVLLAAWGNFAAADVTLDVASGMPGVRTRELANCRSQTVTKDCHSRWISENARPLILRMSEFGISASSCTCALHAALSTLCTLFVHGVRDRRQGIDHLYIGFNPSSVDECTRQRFVAFADSVIAQVDYAFRKVGSLGLETEDGALHSTIRNLSERERDIMQWLGQGKTNGDIAALLNISRFTVKNHIQRIFRKFGVANRTHAAAKYNDALRLNMTNNSRPSLNL